MWPGSRRERVEVGLSSAGVHPYAEQRRPEIGPRSREAGYILQPRAGSGRTLTAMPVIMFSLPLASRM